MKPLQIAGAFLYPEPVEGCKKRKQNDTNIRKYHDNANDDGHDDAPHAPVLPKLTEQKVQIESPFGNT
jgi:hypothetical protein